MLRLRQIDPTEQQRQMTTLYVDVTELAGALYELGQDAETVRARMEKLWARFNEIARAGHDEHPRDPDDDPRTDGSKRQQSRHKPHVSSVSTALDRAHAAIVSARLRNNSPRVTV